MTVSRQGLPQLSVPAFSLLFARVVVTIFTGTVDSGINRKWRCIVEFLFFRAHFRLSSISHCISLFRALALGPQADDIASVSCFKAFCLPLKLSVRAKNLPFLFYENEDADVIVWHCELKPKITVLYCLGCKITEGFTVFPKCSYTGTALLAQELTLL